MSHTEDTLFDLLMMGKTPQQQNALRKVLKQWADGDENSFPVQMALLTQSQWDAAGRMILEIKEAEVGIKKTWDSVYALQRRLDPLEGQIATILRKVEESHLKHEGVEKSLLDGFIEIQKGYADQVDKTNAAIEGFKIPEIKTITPEDIKETVVKEVQELSGVLITDFKKSRRLLDFSWLIAGIILGAGLVLIFHK